MHLLYLLLGTCLAAAAPRAISHSITDQTLSEMVPRNLTADEVHSNVMAYHPADRIVTSANLHQYFEANFGANHTIYLRDERKFVSMSTVRPVSKMGPRDKRETGPCISPWKYTKTYTKQTGQWYSNWQPASYNPKCLYTGLSNAGGYSQMSYSFTSSISESAGLDWKVIADVLSVSLGLSVTQSWTHTSTWTCKVVPNSVVQVWAQPYVAWGWFWSHDCGDQLCGDGCGPEYVNGGATAPVQDHYNAGCSTGQENVKC
ncbi:hypothetical protein N7534_006822 [Penicillium rubens]|nr:hypothetical protein N7534_006822 [Penicillium rubens]